MALNDLNQMFSIVDPNTGKPTDYLMRLLRDRGFEVSSLDELVKLLQENVEALETAVEAIDGTVFSAGTGLGGGGTLGSDDPISFNLNAILNNLNDVDTVTTAPTDGQALIWSDADSEWVPGDVASGGGGGGGANRCAKFSVTTSYTTPSFSDYYVDFGTEDYDDTGVVGSGVDNEPILIPSSLDGEYVRLRAGLKCQENGFILEHYIASTASWETLLGGSGQSNASPDNHSLVSHRLQVATGDKFRVYGRGDDKTLQAGSWIEIEFLGDAISSGGGGGGATPLGIWRDEKAGGTDGGSFTGGSWQTRTLNTEHYNDITGASLASNEITLPAGTYRVNGRVPGLRLDRFKSRLYNVTDSAVELDGNAVFSKDRGDASADSTISGVFTIAGTKNFRVEMRSEDSEGTFGAGASFNSPASGTEIYTSIEIEKIA